VRASRIVAGIPPHGAGQRIGLFGGSFNPPHEGHRRVALTALQRLYLDWVWWLVSPGNPLKRGRPLPPLEARLAATARIAAHPRMVATGLEAELGTSFTVDTIERLRQRRPVARFVWIMGADGLAELHRWGGWRGIAAAVPIAVVGRPGWEAAALSAPAAHALLPWRLPEAAAPALADYRPPAWLLLTAPRTPASSTALRARQTDVDVAATTRQPA
jgi:nicotinate-nucleotide adenylyltransferase